MKSLNVGCGSDPWGDVRVDVAFRFITMHFKPTVLADAHHLPFKDGSFELVKASHLLEHLRNPPKALDEILRVATKEVVEISDRIRCSALVCFKYFSAVFFRASLGISNKKEEITSLGY